MSSILYFSNCSSLDDLNATKENLYRMFGLQRVKPDQFPRKSVDAEFNHLKSVFEADLESDEAFQYSVKPEETFAAEKTLDEVLAAVRDWDCDAEVCGKWLWLSGRKINRRFNDLKELGFRYAKNKKAWYWRPESDAKSPNHQPVPMELIREKYGTRKVALAQ